MQLAQLGNFPEPTIFAKFKFGGAGHNTTFFFSNPDLIGDIVSPILTYAIIIAGLFFFVKLIMAGFSYLTSAGDSAKIQSATKNLTNAGLGLIIVLTAYFIMQILQLALGINILPI